MSDKRDKNDTEPVAKSADEARQRAFELIYQKWPGIINVFTTHAIAGSVPHAKFLHDWADIASPAAKEEPKDDKEKPANLDAEFSLAQLILDTLAAYDRGELKRM